MKALIHVLAISVLASSLPCQDMYGVGPGRLLVLDSRTGDVQEVASGLPTMIGLARATDGRMWTHALGHLCLVDAIAHRITPMFRVAESAIVRGAAPGPANSVYLNVWAPWNATCAILQVDTTSGSVAIVARVECGLAGVRALGAVGDQLYVWSDSDGLIEIDPLTGEQTTVGGNAYITWLTADDAGELYGGSQDGTWRIDRATGAMTLLSNPQASVLGATFGGFGYPIGQGCGHSGPLELTVEGSLEAGGVLFARSEGVQPSFPYRDVRTVMIIGLSATDYMGVPLPLDLGFLGRPGCSLYTNVVATSGVASLSGGGRSQASTVAFTG